MTHEKADRIALPQPIDPDDPVCPSGWPIEPDTGLPAGPCGYIGCCGRPGPGAVAGAAPTQPTRKDQP